MDPSWYWYLQQQSQVISGAGNYHHHHPNHQFVTTTGTNGHEMDQEVQQQQSQQHQHSIECVASTSKGSNSKISTGKTNKTTLLSIGETKKKGDKANKRTTCHADNAHGNIH